MIYVDKTNRLKHGKDYVYVIGAHYIIDIKKRECTEQLCKGGLEDSLLFFIQIQCSILHDVASNKMKERKELRKNTNQHVIVMEDKVKRDILPTLNPFILDIKDAIIDVTNFDVISPTLFP